MPFLDRFELAAKAGFRAVEFLFPYAYPMAEIKRRLAEHQLELVLHNLPAGDWGRRRNAASPACRTGWRSSAAVSTWRSSTPVRWA